MSREELRRAAGRIRSDLCYGGSGHHFYEAIADWLDASASGPRYRASVRGLPIGETADALTVARAYLGEAA